MAITDFGIPCQHTHQGIFSFTLTCPDCRRLSQLQSRKDQPIKNNKKANKKEKQWERRLNKYGNNNTPK